MEPTECPLYYGKMKFRLDVEQICAVVRDHLGRDDVSFASFEIALDKEIRAQLKITGADAILSAVCDRLQTHQIYQLAYERLRETNENGE